MLGTMKVKWVVDRKKNGGFHYKFMDCVYEGYSRQDNIQIAFAIQEIRRRAAECYPLVLEIVIQSKNASFLSSQEHI